MTRPPAHIRHLLFCTLLLLVLGGGLACLAVLRDRARALVREQGGMQARIDRLGPASATRDELEGIRKKFEQALGRKPENTDPVERAGRAMELAAKLRNSGLAEKPALLAGDKLGGEGALSALVESLIGTQNLQLVHLNDDANGAGEKIWELRLEFQVSGLRRVLENLAHPDGRLLLEGIAIERCADGTLSATLKIHTPETEEQP